MPTNLVHTYCLERLLARGRWERDVRVGVDGEGRIVSGGAGGEPTGCEWVPGWTVPGVPNVHSHAFQRALAGLAEGGGPDTFWSWRDVMYRSVERLSPDDVEAVAAQLYVELLKAGFTCVGEFHYLHHAPDGQPYDDPAEMSRRILAAARTSGIGLVHMPTVYEAGGLGGEPLEGAQRRFRLDVEGAARMHEALAIEFSGPGERLGWAFHSLRAVRAESFDGIEGRPVHIHVAEQEKEVRDCLASRGVRPVAWLLENVPMDDRWCLVHATHAGPSELAAVAERGAVVGLCPTTEANLGDGLFPLGAFARMAGRFAVGTDSHVSRSPVEELRLLEYGQRLVTKSRSVLGSSDVNGHANGAVHGAGGELLRRAWDGGCQALAWDGGRVEPGLRADFVTLDAEHPALVGRDGAAVLDSWVFSGTDNPVRDVMVGGRWVVRDGRHEHEEEVVRAYREAVKRLR